MSEDLSNPLLSLVVVLTLTVGIGINASIFTVVNGMMLRPHVYKDPESFVRIVPQSRLQSVPRQASYQEYLHLRDQTRTIRIRWLKNFRHNPRKSAASRSSRGPRSPAPSRSSPRMGA